MQEDFFFSNEHNDLQEPGLMSRWIPADLSAEIRAREGGALSLSFTKQMFPGIQNGPAKQINLRVYLDWLNEAIWAQALVFREARSESLSSKRN